MSNYVDERIVEMKFDNQNFEKNVQVSLKTLEELNKRLKLEDAGKSFESIQNASSKIDLSNLANNVQAVADRCSVLGIVGDEVVRRLTSGFMDLNQAVIATVKSLTIDQVGVGFDKYERKVQSVQTIMNATGRSIEDVNESLDKLNWFTDETSYSYADMVDNISKFTSSNVDLETAVTSMIGIADAAGLAGVNTQDASHAMEGFSKAIAQGYMSRQNWQWIRTAHMDTTKFKDTLIQAAIAEGTLTKAIDGTYKTVDNTTVSIEDFETALKDGWMTTKVINKALNEFGGTTEKIYEEYKRLDGKLATSQIIDTIGIDIEDLGLKSFKAAQEAKTFTDAINSVKDAVSTGWMVSFEQIFGNYEEARKFWTDVANEMWNIFASGGESRNELISEVFSGPFSDFKSEISSLGVSLDQFEDSLGNVVANSGLDVEDLTSRYGSLIKALRAGAITSDMAKDALRNLANELVSTSTESVDLNEKLSEIKGKVNEVIQGVYGNGDDRRKALEELGYSYEYIQGLVNQILLEGREITLDDVKIFEQEIQNLTGITEEQRQALLAFVEGNEEANASFDELIENISKKSGQELVHEMILNLLGGIKDVQEAARAASEEIFGSSEDRASFIYSILETLHSLSERLRLSADDSENLRKTISGLLSILRFFTVTGEKLLTVLSPIKELFNLSGESVLKFTGNIGESITEFVKWYENLEEVSEATENLRSKVERVVKVIKRVITFVRGLAEKYLPLVSEGIKNIKTNLDKSPVVDFLRKVRNGLRNLWRNIEKIDFESINIDLSSFSDYIDGAVEAISGFYNSIKDYLTPYIDEARTALSNFNIDLTPITAKFTNFKNTIRESGGIIEYFRGKISEAKTNISDFLNNGGLGSVFNGFANRLNNIKIRLSTFISSIKKGLEESGIIKVLTDLFNSGKEELDKFIKDVKKKLEDIDWGNVLAFSIGFSLVAAILSISYAFKELGAMFKTGKGVFASIKTILTKFINGFKTKVMEIAEAAVAFSVAVAILAGAIWLLATKVPADDLKRTAAILGQVMLAFTGMFVAIAAAIKILKVDSKAMLGILAFAGSIALLAVAMRVLQDVKLDFPHIFAILGLMAAMAFAAVALSKFGVKLDGAGLYFLSFAGAILLLTAAMEKIAKIPEAELLKSERTLTGLIMALGVAVAATKLIKGSAVGLLGLLGAILLLTLLMQKIGDGSLDGIMQKAKDNIGTITFVLGTIMLLTILLGKLDEGKNAAKIGIGVAALAASLFIVIAAIKKFNEFDTNELIKGGLAVVAILTMFALITAAMSIGKPGLDGAKAGVGIAVMSASLLLVYFAVKQFSKMDVNSLRKGLGVIVAILSMYAVLLGMTALTGLGKTGPIIAMAVGLVAVVAALIILTLYDFAALQKSVLLLGETLVILVAAMACLGGIKIDTKVLMETIIIAGLIFVLAKSLELLAEKDWMSLAAAAAGITICLIAVSGCIKSLSEVEFDKDHILGTLSMFAAMLAAVLVIGVTLYMLADKDWTSLTAAMFAISGCLIAIVEAIKILSNVEFGVEDILPKFGALGLGIIAFAIIGVILKYLGEFSWSGHVATATAISEVLLAVAAALRIMQGIPAATAIQSAIGLMAAIAIIGAVGAFVAWAVSKIGVQVSKDFITIGENLSKFFESLSGIKSVDPSIGKTIEAVGIGFGALAVGNFFDTITKLINNGSGVFDGLEDNMTKLGKGLKALGENSPSEDELSKIDLALAAMLKIAQISQKLPAQGGWLQKIIGDSSVGGFGEQLKTFGAGLKEFGAATTGLNTKGIEDSVPAVENIVKIANMLPVSGGILDVFLGSTDWAGVSQGLRTFGAALVIYATQVEYLDNSIIENSITAVENISKIADMIANSDHLKEIFAGSVDMSDFKNRLTTYAEAIRDFSIIAGDIDYDSLKKASDLKDIGASVSISMADGIKNNGHKVTGAMTDVVKLAKEAANKEFSSFYLLGMEAIVSIAAGIAGNVGKAKETIASKSQDVISEVEAIINKIPPAINNKETSILNAVAYVLYSCYDKINSYYSDFEYAAGYLAGGFANGFTLNSLSYGITTTMDQCVSTIEDYYLDFYYAGKFLIQGIANGLDGNAYIATNAMRNLGQDMYDTFCEYNQIYSPSRVYSKLAEYIPEGLAKGLEDNSDISSNAASEIGYDMITAITPALAMLADLVNGDFEISPEIRPVVDLSEVYSSAEMINGIFAENNMNATARAGKISRNITDFENYRFDSMRSEQAANSRVSSPVINNYIYTQPGQNTEEIASEVERRMVRSLTQRKVAFAR